ncbi:unnamed protein product, partial [Owenia fusiformis]
KMATSMKAMRIFQIRSLFNKSSPISTLFRVDSPVLIHHNSCSTSASVKQDQTNEGGQKRRGNVKQKIGISFAGLGLGVLAGAYVNYKLNNGSEVKAQVDRPYFKPSRSIKNDADHSGLKLTLYQYQTCPFCCKVRAYLDYHGFSYDVIEVNSVWRTQTKWSKYKKVPVLVCEGKDIDGYVQINDSSVIISLLESHLFDSTQKVSTLVDYFPVMESKEGRKTILEYPNRYFVMYGVANKDIKSSTDIQRKEERKWRRWVDNDLVHVLSPNIYRTASEALRAFKYFDEVGNWEQNFSTFERTVIMYVGAAAMYLVGKLLKRKYMLKDDVRESLYESCKTWTKAVGNKRKFMGGDIPNLADISVYGVLSAIEGCESFQDLLENSDIRRWYYDMKQTVSSHQGANPLNKPN